MSEEDREICTLNNGKNIRLYKINGNITKYPSVTAILGIEEKLYLKDWKLNNAQSWEKILLFANTVGTVAHYIIQKELANKWNIPHPDLQLNEQQRYAYNMWFDSFEHSTKYESIKEAIEQIKMFLTDWIIDYDPKPPILQINNKITEYPLYPFEVRVFSHNYGYAGSIDILCSINNENKLVDIKSNDKEDHEDYHLQTNGYLLALNELYPNLDIKKINILSMPKENLSNSKFYRYNFEEVDTDPTYWLIKVAKFYKLYGHEEPFNRYVEQVSKNLLKYNIDLNDDLKKIKRQYNKSKNEISINS